MNRLTYLLTVLCLLIVTANKSNGQQESQTKDELNNNLTNKEIKDGWKLLWAGKTNAGCEYQILDDRAQTLQAIAGLWTATAWP